MMAGLEVLVDQVKLTVLGLASKPRGVVCASRARLRLIDIVPQ